MSTKEKYKALISTLLSAWGGKTTVKAAKSVEINGKFHKPVSVVVESWTADDGTSWYRKYSDGWIEQGGNPGGVGTMGTMDTTITFPVPFTNTNYFIGGVGFVIANVGSAYILSATTTGFTTSSVMHQSGTPSWYACGY